MTETLNARPVDILTMLIAQAVAAVAKYPQYNGHFARARLAVTVKDTKMHGYTIPAGTDVILIPGSEHTSLHRSLHTAFRTAEVWTEHGYGWHASCIPASHVQERPLVAVGEDRYPTGLGHARVVAVNACDAGPECKHLSGCVTVEWVSTTRRYPATNFPIEKVASWSTTQ
jgi:hypothetical protein